MARIGVFVGVGDEQNATYAAEKIRSATGFVGDVIRLRDRTGPSVAERVTALEAANADTVSRCGAMFREIGDRTVNMCDKRVTDVEKRLDALESALGEPVCVGCGGTVGQHHAPDGGGCSGWFPTVREHLARFETEHRAAVYRISDLERDPVASEAEPYETIRVSKVAVGAASPPATTEPTPEQIEAYLRGSAEWEGPTEIAGHSGLWWHRFRDGFVIRADEDESAFFELLQEAESRTPAEMRARILGASSGAADPDRLAKVATDDDLLDLFERSEYASGDTRAARRALYDLGREHGRAERAAPARHEAEALDALRPYNDTRDPGEIGNLVADIASLVADWQRRGEDLEAIRATRRTAAQERDDVVAYVLDMQRRNRVEQDCHHRKILDGIRNGEHVRTIQPTPHVPDGETRDRPATLTEAEMAAELREAGWRHTERWGWVAPGDGNTTIWTTATAHAAMRAAKGAK